jgi:Flp pilus assembly protein TadG
MKNQATRSSERGAVMVEAALTMLMFLVILFAIMEAGRIFNIQQTLNNAAREGARLSVAPLSQTNTLATQDQVTQRVQTFLQASGLNGATATITVDQAHAIGSGSTVGTLVTVRVPYNVLTTSIFSTLQVNLRGQALMRNETSP